MNISITSIPHEAQRYNTVGDWQFNSKGNLSITVSRFKQPREYFEFLISLHELIEACLCKRYFISQAIVDTFNMNHPELDEPGESIEAPHHQQHEIAGLVERLVCIELGIDWNEYSQAVEDNLYLKKINDRRKNLEAIQETGRISSTS